MLFPAGHVFIESRLCVRTEWTNGEQKALVLTNML